MRPIARSRAGQAVLCGSCAGVLGNHRTDAIDHIAIMSGEVDMELGDPVVHLKAGDVMVLRGTIHIWIVRGTAIDTLVTPSSTP